MHQSCYGIPEVPEGNWYCDVCEINQNPEEIVCELCSNFGGAYKRTDDNKWIHSLCALWIPDIYSVASISTDETRYTLRAVDKQRYKLKCYCGKKGAAAQCSFGRCAIAAHPWCVIHNPKGFTNRIVKTEDGEVLCEIFCKQHAVAVKEPIKPKSKPKTNKSFDDLDADEFIEKTTKRSKSRDDLAMDKSKIVLSMDHALLFSNSSAVTQKPTKKRIVDDDNTEGQTGGEIPNEEPKFQPYTMCEWPGQSEGEPMDLDHFWKVVSLYYAEDPTITSNILGAVREIFGSTDNKELMCLPCLAQPNDKNQYLVSEAINAQLSGFSDKDRNNLFDEEKRVKMLSRVLEDIAYLEGNGPKVGSSHQLPPSGSSTSNLVPAPDAVDTSIGADCEDKVVESYNKLAADLILDDVSFLTKQLHSHKVVTTSTNAHVNTISAVFDGINQRYSCEFKVIIDDKSINVDEAKKKEKAVKSWTKLSVKDSDSMWVQRYIIGIIHDSTAPVDCNYDVHIGVAHINSVYEDESINLADRVIVPRDDSDQICRFIKTDQVAYRALAKAANAKLDKLLELSNLLENANRITETRNSNSLIENKYKKQTVWRKIAENAVRGMCDQASDAKQDDQADIPASWKIQVDGRPPPPSEDEVLNESQDDSTCMCCFDGTSADNNSIVFCDGCNAAMHQYCYGVLEIPDGDYFCDRCRGIQAIVDDEDLAADFDASCARETIKCCLCPNYHGGIKATTDGRWVHVCCAIWSKDAIISDLYEMGPIDVSNVQVQLPSIAADDRRGRSTLLNVETSDITESCAFCSVRGGLVIRCSHEWECATVFHPLCAWFHGLYVESAITDPAFLGSSRNGVYPSGLDIRFFCNAHCPPNSEPRRAEQLSLRTKYRIKIEDLDQIPKRKRTKKSKGSTSGSSRSATTSAVIDLKPDIYESDTCAMCLVSYITPLTVDEPVKITCNTCYLTAHFSCVADLYDRFDKKTTNWTCASCILGETDPRCYFCPRRGGSFIPTHDDKFSHVFCAKNAPGLVKLNNGVVDVRSIPKECRKAKCSLCNRKTGICVKCTVDGCENYFHSICGERSGRGFQRTRLGFTDIYCSSHIPAGIERLPSGLWADGHEVLSLRLSLDRARIILDTISRREKLKRLQCKAEGELFQVSFQCLLNKATNSSTSNEEDESNLQCLYESDESEYFSDEDHDNMGIARYELFEPLVSKTGEQQEFTTSEDVQVLIGPTWYKKNQVKAPRKLAVFYSGIDVTSKTVDPDMDSRVFIKKVSDRVTANLEFTRQSCGIFANGKEANAFNKDMGVQLARHVLMSNDEFANEMKEKHDIAVKFSKLETKVSSDSKPKAKKGYAIVEEADDPFDIDLDDISYDGQEPVHRKRKGAPGNSGSSKKSKDATGSGSLSYLSIDALTAKLIDNPITQGYQHSIEQVNGFENILPIINIDSAYGDSLDDWKVFDGNELPLLERRIQDILFDLDAVEIDDNNVIRIADNMNAVLLGDIEGFDLQKKPSRNTSNDADERLLLDDFAAIPYKFIPDYKHYVRRLVTVDYLKQKLKLHMYQSMAEFSKDFYEMLNNGRAVTTDSSQTWIDTKILCDLFEKLKKQSVHPSPVTTSRSPGSVLKCTKVDKQSSKSYNGPGEVTSCVVCKTNYAIENGFPDRKIINSAFKGSQWCWVCPGCIQSEQTNLLNKKVHVYWKDDNCMYSGVINYYDKASLRHRVQYDDGMWEFIPLSLEIVLFEDQF